MTTQIIILQGGEDVKQRTNESLFRNVRGLSSAGKILVIPWTSDSPEKETAYSKGGWGDGKFYPGFGLVDFYVTAHYKLGAGQVAKADTTINVNIPENMWITVASEK